MSASPVAVILALTGMSAPALADQGAIVGATLTLQPGAGEVTGGGLGGWAAVTRDDFYLGGELAFETYTSGKGEFAISYHALAGARTSLGSRVELLADAGLGVSQQTSFRLAILGGESELEHEGWSPSAAGRLHLVGILAHVNQTRVGIALTGDARIALDSSRGAGVGLAVHVSR